MQEKQQGALLTPEMEQIIERWGNPDKSLDNYVFPFLTGNETPIEQKKRIGLSVYCALLKMRKLIYVNLI